MKKFLKLIMMVAFVLVMSNVINVDDVRANVSVEDVEDNKTYSNSSTPLKLSNGTKTITLNGVDINDEGVPAISVEGNAHLTIILAEGSNNILQGGDDCAGIEVERGATLTIQGTGTLTATGGEWAAGIGGGNVSSTGNIIIEDGIITANGGFGAAGIGGCIYRDGNNITITGGKVTATGGGGGAAGIGGGSEGNGGNITITDGKVTATGGNGNSNRGGGGAGIGSGYSKFDGTITITGGTVTATGGNKGTAEFGGGAGIGGGYGRRVSNGVSGGGATTNIGGNIIISGGTVEATGKDGAAGIGAGKNGGVSGTFTTTKSGTATITATGGEGEGAGPDISDVSGQVIWTGNINDTQYICPVELEPSDNEVKAWVPTTPEEIYAYGLFGAGDYVDIEGDFYSVSEQTNDYPIEMKRITQGPLCIATMKNYEIGGYTLSRTYNILPEGADWKNPIYKMDKAVEITLKIPTALQKEGCTYRMSCVTENGMSFLLEDIDNDPNTITFRTDRFYAFALYYRD